MNPPPQLTVVSLVGPSPSQLHLPKTAGCVPRPAAEPEPAGFAPGVRPLLSSSWSKSRRNGLAKVLGRGDLDWRDRNPTGFVQLELSRR